LKIENSLVLKEVRKLSFFSFFFLNRFARLRKTVNEEIMSKICEICGKRPMIGNKIARRGLAQNVKTIVNGAHKTIRVCAKCIKAGKIKK